MLKGSDVSGRTPSASFLIWFLQTIYRLDEIESHDAVCDRKLDKGIDALVVNDGEEELVLFQAKRAEKLPTTLGDTDLKQFVGALAQFRTEQSISELASTTKNDDLRRLLQANRVAEKVGKGYRLRPIFISNVTANNDAIEYLKHARNSGDEIELWDLARIAPVLDQLSQQEWFVPQAATLRLNPRWMFHDEAKDSPDIVISGIQASELVKLPGISDTRIFAQNVRLGLGNTRVNTELASSIQDKNEHANFLAFHNGLTIVAKEVIVNSGTITVRNYSVCNGCQSLMALHKHQSSLTKKLVILVRFVRVGDDRKLAASIAYKTNNQNPISLRDLNANTATQIQLKAEFDQLYGDDTTYMIKRGVKATTEELHNETAGQMLLSLYAQQPWSAHQKYKIFGELESEIFRYGISASHIRLAQLMMRSCVAALERCENHRIRSYGLTRFLLLYYVGELLRKEADGASLLDDPAKFLNSASAPPQTKQLEKDVLQQINELANFAVTELNYYITNNGGDIYDYKSEFKSEKGVKALRSEILKCYDKDKYRNRVETFTLPAVRRQKSSRTKGKPRN